MRPSPLAPLLAAALLAVGCSGYGLEGGGPSPRAGSGDLVAPQRTGGDRLDLRESGCELPAETVFILRFPVRVDGTTGEVEFTKGEPSECIASYVAGVVAGWRFEAATLGGEPVEVFFNRTLNSPH